jgi:hypothetical protein
MLILKHARKMFRRFGMITCIAGFIPNLSGVTTFESFAERKCRMARAKSTAKCI